MFAKRYSQDLWDYLGDMDYMPSRADRDALVEAARVDPAKEKRVRIWDYFFRIKPEDVGKPQRMEMEELEKQMREENSISQMRQARIKTTISRLELELQGNRIGLVVAIVIVGIAFVQFGAGSDLAFLWQLMQQSHFDLEIVFSRSAPLGFVRIGMAILGAWIFLHNLRAIVEKNSQLEQERTDRDKEEQRHRTAIEQIESRKMALLSEIEALKRQIPTPPSDEEIRQWLQEDIEWLSGRAKERSGLEQRLIPLKDAPNPLCILGPAELQEESQIPQPFVKDADRNKHLKARRFAILSDGTFEDFYAVYYLEFILVAEDMLGTYGCFFDFVSCKVTGEHTSEQYYHDVVAISTHREYREFEIGGTKISIEDAPTFNMSLSSGERRAVTFASTSFFEGIRKQMGAASVPQFDLRHWARNPEIAAENAIRALRARLRAHKGTLESGTLS